MIGVIFALLMVVLFLAIACINFVDLVENVHTIPERDRAKILIWVGIAIANLVFYVTYILQYYY